MKTELVDKIVNAVLYEGYMLYPYRRSSLKNRHRWNFGLVYPQGMDPCRMTTECLLQGCDPTVLRVEVRFLQLYEKDSWQEAVERRISALDIGVHTFDCDGLRGDVRVTREPLQPGVQKVRVEISNRTGRNTECDPLLQCLVSTHTILTASGGEFVSLLDPPEQLRLAAESCRNVCTWPVLVGQQGARDCILSSPIILYDYPRVAEESPGDLFDSTEIDELLTLRLLTLTDAEKQEIRLSGERERQLLERVESLPPEQLLRLHGTMRDLQTGLKPGDRVRLRPRAGGDVFDVVLDGRVAIIESIEQDFDNRTHIAVVIEDDPGKEFGLMRQPGHRFFFSPDEMERIL